MSSPFLQVRPILGENNTIQASCITSSNPFTGVVRMAMPDAPENVPTLDAHSDTYPVGGLVRAYYSGGAPQQHTMAFASTGPACLDAAV